MANKTYTGRGAGPLVDSDYKELKFVGKTKAGQAVTIKVYNAINVGNLDWAFAEKNDVIAELEFKGTYDPAKLDAGDYTEPWDVTFADGTTAGPGEIMLGVGKFYIGDECIGLTRGGGSFTVENEYRDINADDDPGTVKGRTVKDGATPKLKFKALQLLVNVAELYPGVVLKTA